MSGNGAPQPESGTGTPPSPDLPGGNPQHIQITSGNGSPVSVNAPQAHASGGNASANVTVNPPPEKSGDHSYTVVIAIGTVIIAIGTIALLYYTVFPHK